jgi:GNAT superfamily N-acetyltransferase
VDPLSAYLASKGHAPGIGPETGSAPKSGNGIARYKSPHGSTRYVYYANGQALSVLQVVSRDGKSASVANVYTAPEARRQGIAATLLRRAEKDFRFVTHASESNLSSDAKVWIESLDRASKEKREQVKRWLK